MGVSAKVREIYSNLFCSCTGTGRFVFIGYKRWTLVLIVSISGREESLAFRKKHKKRGGKEVEIMLLSGAERRRFGGVVYSASGMMDFCVCGGVSVRLLPRPTQGIDRPTGLPWGESR